MTFALSPRRNGRWMALRMHVGVDVVIMRHSQSGFELPLLSERRAILAI